MKKKPSRLQFSEEELQEPSLKRKVLKMERTEERLEKAEAKIPTKTVVKPKVEQSAKGGKPKIRLQFEESRKKAPSKLNHAVQTAPTAVIQKQVHQELQEAKEDNVGVEAADTITATSQSTSQILHEGIRSRQLKPYRTAAKAEKQFDKAAVDALAQKAQLDNPTSNPVSKWQQKQAIKRQYAAAKAGKVADGTQKTAQAASQAVRSSTTVAEKTISFFKNHKRGFLVIISFLMLLAFILNAVSSCTVILEGIGSGIAASTYASSDDAITGAEEAYCAMEAALQSKLDNYESTHDYDAYTYDLDDIGHDPYVLTSILSALHPGEWTLPEVMGTLDMLFEKQYVLTETVESEIKYRWEMVPGQRHAKDPITGQYLYDIYGNPIMEDYEYPDYVPYTHYSCTVTLENRDLSHLPVEIMGEEQLGMYAVYMSTLGNRTDLFPGSEYIGKYTTNHPTYEVPPEALADEQFAAMLKEAEKYLGYPYVWGGSSPSTSFDCSGFVCWVVNHSGWNVGRVSAQGLRNICTAVSSANVKPGDLVFFKGTYDTPGVSHVGIYVGNNVMIHCGDPISYANLNSNYWQRHFYCYGRLP